MNKENLEKAVALLETIEDKHFDIKLFIKGASLVAFKKLKENSNCGTVGCIVGHCIVLDYDNFINNYIIPYPKFTIWSVNFFEVVDEEWDFLFSSDWQASEFHSTKEGAINRLEYAIKYDDIPDNYSFNENTKF